jgi:hypothetical protein
MQPRLGLPGGNSNNEVDALAMEDAEYEAAAAAKKITLPGPPVSQEQVVFV